MKLRIIIKKFLRFISRVGCYLNLPILSFFILSFFIKKIMNRNAKSCNNILILPKTGGREDIYASFKDAPNKNRIYELPRGEIKNLYNFFVRSKDVKNYSYFHNNEIILKEQRNYFDFLKKIIFYLKKFYKINLIINFNFTYKEEVELARASTDRGLKFLTIQKESQASTGKRLVNEIIYKKSIQKYPGSYIAVYNQDEKINIVNSGILEEKKIYVIGSPRVDFSFNISKENKDPDKFCLVYYCIQTGVSLPIYEGEFRTEGILNVSKFNWSRLAEKTENILINFINKQSSQFNMIFKTKTGNSDQIERLKKFDTSNVEIIYNNTGHHLLKKADAIIAFNSTIIFEAIAANTPVIIPHFDLTPIQKKFVFDLSRVENVFNINNENDLELSIEKIKKNNYSNKNQKTENQINVLNKYVGNIDGKSGIRLRNLITEINV